MFVASELRSHFNMHSYKYQCSNISLLVQIPRFLLFLRYFDDQIVWQLCECSAENVADFLQFKFMKCLTHTNSNRRKGNNENDSTQSKHSHTSHDLFIVWKMNFAYRKKNDFSIHRHSIPEEQKSFRYYSFHSVPKKFFTLFCIHFYFVRILPCIFHQQHSHLELSTCFVFYSLPPFVSLQHKYI